MALSTPPPPHNPSSSAAAATTATATATTTTRPLFSTSRPPLTSQPLTAYPHRFPSNPNPFYPQLAPQPPPPPNQSVLYPLASSGRGFLSRPGLTNPNPNQNQGSFLTRPAVAGAYPGPIPPFGLNSHSDPGLGPGLGFPRPTHLLQGHSGPNSGVGAANLLPVVVKGVPVASAHPKVAASLPSFSDFSGLKDARERSKDDSLAVVRERKVNVTETASLYALCRSWLRNGFPEDTQPHYMDGAKSLPKPLPMAPQDAESPSKKEEDKGEEGDESVEHLSTEKLLQIHVKRAKRIRSKLREERLRRIARYKTRLALLLPPMVDQQHRNDSTTGN